MKTRVSLAGGLLITLLACGPNPVDVSTQAPPTPTPSGARTGSGTGFFVSGNKLYDANGHEFVMKGVNANVWWGDQSRNLAAITDANGIAKSRANAVRIVGSAGTTGNAFGVDTPAEWRDVVEKVIARKMVPVVECHDATGDTDNTDFNNVVSFWVRADNVAWLKQYERYVILNVANEYGYLTKTTPDDPTIDSDRWASDYKAAITRLRNAGLKCALMIDANLGGNDLTTLYNKAKELLAHDPEHNIIFSMHAYKWGTVSPGGTNSWHGNRDGYRDKWTWPRWQVIGSGSTAIAAPFFIEDQINYMKNYLGVCLVIGEFAATKYQGVDNYYKTEDIINRCNYHAIGWLAWSWNGNGNEGNADKTLSTDIIWNQNQWEYRYQFNSWADLTPFGELIINSLSTANRATIF